MNFASKLIIFLSYKHCFNSIDQLPRAIVARDFRHRVVGLVGVALQEAAAVSGEEFQRMRLAPARGVVEQHDGWAGPAMTTVISDDGPEEAALGAFQAARADVHPAR